MKLDLDLVRNALVFVEDRPASAGMCSLGINPDPAKAEASFTQNAHFALLIDHGLVAGNHHEDELMRPVVVNIHGLTMQGHEFLSQVRSSTVWEKLKAKTAEAGGAMTLAILQSLGERITARMLGLDTE